MQKIAAKELINLDKNREENGKPETKEKRIKEIDFSFQQINDYPLSDKNLVVNPQIIPLAVDDLPLREIENI